MVGQQQEIDFSKKNPPLMSTLPESQCLSRLSARVQPSDGPFALCRQKANDGHEHRSDPPSRLPILWMVACDAQTHFFV